MAKIAIRADGGKSIGMGHVIRTLVLAKELRKCNDVIYICRDNKNKYEAGINKIISEGFKVYKINESNLMNNIIELQMDIKADLIITDSYDVDEYYFDKIKEGFKYSGYIDDVNICRLNVDFILNQNINAKDIEYNTKPNNNVKLFLGPKFCLLRDEFRKEQDKTIKEKVNDVLITVGGMDKDFNTIKILELIKKRNINLHVVIGGAFEEELIKKIENISKEFYNIKLYKNANMSELMSKCDMAISASGSTLYELCAMQVPTIGIVVADNQRDICKTLNNMEVIIGTDDIIYKDLEKLDNIIREVMANKELRGKLVNNQKSLVNVSGVELVSKKISEIAHF